MAEVELRASGSHHRVHTPIITRDPRSHHAIDLLLDEVVEEEEVQVEVVVVERPAGPIAMMASLDVDEDATSSPAAATPPPSSTASDVVVADDDGEAAIQQPPCSDAMTRSPSTRGRSAHPNGFSSQMAGEYTISRDRVERDRRKMTVRERAQAGSGSTDGARSPRRGAHHQQHSFATAAPSSPRHTRDDGVIEDSGISKVGPSANYTERLPIPSSNPSATIGLSTSESKGRGVGAGGHRLQSSPSLQPASPQPLGHHHRRRYHHPRSLQAQPYLAYSSQELPAINPGRDPIKVTGPSAQDQASLSYYSPQVRGRSTSAEDVRTQKRSRSGDFSRILPTAPPSPLTSRAPANGSKAWACDQRGNCGPEAPQFPTSFYIERMETLISLTGMKFITAELHTSTIERTKKGESDDNTEVGETNWTATEPGLDEEQSPQATSPTDGGRDRSAKRLQKEEEFFRLFLHYGSYSAPSFAPSPSAGQRPRASTVTGATPMSSGSGDGSATGAPPVFEDQRECRFFSKRERAEKFYGHLIQELTKSGYKKVFIPPSPLMGSYEAQVQLSRGGELFKLVELCSHPASTLTTTQQAKVAKEILHILKNSPPSSPISKTIQSKSVVRYLLKNAFFNLFPTSSSPSSSASSPAATSSSTAPPSATAAPPASPSLSSLRRVGRLLNSSSPSFSPSMQSWRPRSDNPHHASRDPQNNSGQSDLRPRPATDQESASATKNTEEARGQAKPGQPAPKRETMRGEAQLEREKRDRTLIERWRKTLFRIIEIIRENREDGYYTDDQDFNNTHFIKELTQSDLSPCYLYCLLKPFISSQYNTSAAFGFERLSSVEWVLQLVRLNNPLLDQFITFNFYTNTNDSNLLYYCLNSVFKFPRNNILHNLICDTISSIFARDEKRKKCERKHSVSSRSGCYSITTSSGSIATIRDQRANNYFASTSGGYRYGKLNRKLGKFKRVDCDREEEERMDIEVTAQLCSEEDIEDEQELKARREKMTRKWSKDTMKLKRVALVDCLLLEQIVAYFYALRDERQRRDQTRRSMETEATVSVDALPESAGVDVRTNGESDSSSTSLSGSASDQGTEPPSNDPASASSSSSSPVTTSGMRRVIAGTTWTGEENLGPVVKIANRVLRGRHNQYLGCSAHLLTQVLGVEESLARAWLDIVHTDLREINALENSRPFEKPHVSFASPLKNSFDNYHLNFLKLHRR